MIAQILTETPFETFGTSRPVGQNSTDQSWINCEFCGTFGTLEATHTIWSTPSWAGSWDNRTRLDPIFMMHHCNIDRIWWLWNQSAQADSPDSLWTGMTFENSFVNPDGTPYSPTVSDLLVPEPLGYTVPARWRMPPFLCGASTPRPIWRTHSSAMRRCGRNARRACK